MRPHPAKRPSLLCLALVACANSGGGPERAGGDTPSRAMEPLTHSVLLSQQHSGLAEPREQLIRTPADWSRVWAEIRSGGPERVTPGAPSEEQVPPRVDFARDAIVVIAAGEQATAGVTLDITSIERQGAELRVRYTLNRPGPGCLTAQVITAPVIVARVPLTGSAAARFERRTVERPC